MRRPRRDSPPGAPQRTGSITTNNREFHRRDCQLPWEVRFGTTDTALEHTITLNGLPHRIVGLMPKRLRIFRRPLLMMSIRFGSTSAS